MSRRLQNIQQSWRLGAMLLLFVLSFHKGWDWIFWPGFIVLVLSDPATYQRPQPVAEPLGLMLIVAYFLIFGIAVSIMLWEVLTHRAVNTFWAVILLVSGSLAMLFFGIVALRKSKGPMNSPSNARRF